MTAEASPKLNKAEIHRCAAPAGESKEQKNADTALARACEQDDRVCHAVTFSDDQKKLCVVTKQRASMKKDATAWKPVEQGERRTTVAPASRIFGFGSFTSNRGSPRSCHGPRSVKTSWCCCTTGCEKCAHKAAGLWMQLHHWGKGRNSEAPSTLSA